MRTIHSILAKSTLIAQRLSVDLLRTSTCGKIQLYPSRRPWILGVTSCNTTTQHHSGLLLRVVKKRGTLQSKLLNCHLLMRVLEEREKSRHWKGIWQSHAVRS